MPGTDLSKRAHRLIRDFRSQPESAMVIAQREQDRAMEPRLGRKEAEWPIGLAQDNPAMLRRGPSGSTRPRVRRRRVAIPGEGRYGRA